MPSVSVPEKTLEHWSSQYLMYRYRSWAALWWPTSGEDIDVRWLPTRPGKAIQLEMKTTTVVGANLHDVLVDLGQLWEYRQRPLGRQPFYAFPWPDWRGDLTTEATIEGRPVTELAFARSGPGWWFADWMAVLTAAQVEQTLYKDLMAHGCSRRGVKKCMVRFDLTKSLTDPEVTWGSKHDPTGPKVVRWRDFWRQLEQCGRFGWPQLIRLPARFTQARVVHPPSQLAGLLRESAYLIRAGEWGDDNELVTLAPDEDGNYHVVSDPVLDPRNLQMDEIDETSDHRQVVFLEARALFGRGSRRSRR